MLNIDKITYTIRGKSILNGIDLNVVEGETLALLGPNGAGKSTLIDIITGFIKPDSGNITILNSPSFKKVKKDIGILYEYVPLYNYYKVREMINWVSTVYDIKKNTLAPLIESLEIDRIENKLIKVLSKGEKKKLGILISILHNPKLIILDEPTSDLDPFIRDVVWRIIKENNRTIFFTTHIWNEAVVNADRIALIGNGKLLAVDSYENLISGKYLKAEKKITIPEFCGKTLKTNEQMVRYNDEIRIYVDDTAGFFEENKISEYTVGSIDLKDIFLHLLNQQ
ncbi:MAG: ABC transporter ATP-binding protein [Rikenellaceae bacterium]|nr:ABC transporter ATP-binding protein [Rikenellaceae bacterium]